MASSSSTPASAWRAILYGGLAAGAGDLAFALIYYTRWKNAEVGNILRSIAAGLLGPNAQKGGVPVAGLGVGLHFIIAIGAAAVYYVASRRMRFLVEHAVTSGIMYGAVVYFVMNGVVLPLSAKVNVPFPPTISMAILPVLIAHLFLVGLPIGLAVRRWGRG